jgi:hypothetical protein
MRKFQLVIAITILFTSVLSQNTFNRAYHDINEVALPLVTAINGDIYFITSFLDGPHIGQHYLYRHNPAGALKSRIPVLPGIHILFAGTTNDDHLLLTGADILCKDYFSGEPQVNTICKIDTIGGAVFTTTFNSAEGDHPVTSLQYHDSSFYTFTSKKIFHFSKSGQFISQLDHGLTNITSVLLLPNNNFVVSSVHLGVNSLVEMSPSVTVASSNAFPVLLNKMLFGDGQKIIGQGTDGKLYKISSSFNLMSSGSFGTSQVSDFVYNQDTIYAVLKTAIGNANYAVCDTSFNTISLTATTTQSLFQNALCLYGANVAILSNGLSSTTNNWYGQHYYTALSVIDKFGSNDFTEDIALLSVDSDSAFAKKSNSYSPVHHLYLRAKIRIKNNGPHLINSFKLNCSTAPPGLCGHSFYQELFTGLSVAPGAIDTLVTSGFIDKYFETEGTTVVDNFCLYTSLPNGEVDKTLSDNELCKNFTFIVNSLDEAETNLPHVALFPNPFQNTLKVESTTGLESIGMYNSLGAKIKDLSVQKELSVTFDNAELNTGIYFMKIRTEKGTVIKKVAKL